jgi:cell division protein FtsB
MRISRRVTRSFRQAAFPLGTLALAAYFGYFAVWGERGYQAQIAVQTRLDAKQAELGAMVAMRLRLEHRIDLLEKGDPDLVEELARTQLMDGAPDQVAVPRQPHDK